jgi:hypothetical protein
LLIESLLFPSLLIKEGEEEEDNADYNAAAAAAAATNDDSTNNKGGNDKAAMPHKVKLVAAAAMKKPAAKAETMTLPTPSPPLNFSVDSTNKYGITYYCKGTQDFADVVIHVNGCLPESEYRMSMSQDEMSVLFEHSINSMCYAKNNLAAIIGNAYSPSNHCVVAYDNIAQEMFAKKVRSNNKRFGDQRR